MLKTFSKYYKTKPKNELKNKTNLVTTSASLSLHQRSLFPLTFLDPVTTNLYFLSPLIFIQHHSLFLFLLIYSLLVCQLLYFVSAAVVTSSQPLSLPRLRRRRCCPVSAVLLLLSPLCHSWYFFYLSKFLSNYLIDLINCF